MINVAIQPKEGLPFMQAVKWPRFHAWKRDGGPTAREMRQKVNGGIFIVDAAGNSK